MEKYLLGSRIRVSTTWWAKEREIRIKLKPRRRLRPGMGEWKAGDDMYIKFLGLHIGFIWWSNQRALEICIHPAYLMCLRPDGSKRIWRGIRMRSKLRPIGLKKA